MILLVALIMALALAFVKLVPGRGLGVGSRLDFARERDSTPGKVLHRKACKSLERFEQAYAAGLHHPTEALAMALGKHRASVVSKLNEIGMMLPNDMVSEQSFRAGVVTLETYMQDREHEVRRLGKMPAPVLDNFPG